MGQLGSNRMRKTARDVGWYLVDGNGVEVDLDTLGAIGTGNYTPADYADVNIMERGEFVHRRKGDAQPGTFSIDLHELMTTSTAEVSLFDVVYWGKNTSSYAYLNLLPTSGTREVPEWTLRRKLEGTTHGDSATHTVDLQKTRLRISQISDEIEGNKLQLQGEHWTWAIVS